MSLKNYLLVFCGAVILIVSSEVINYLSDPASRISQFVDNYFIEQAIKVSRQGNLQASLKNLTFASAINIYGEYDYYRGLLPKDYLVPVIVPQKPSLEKAFLDYISSLTVSSLTNTEDQGLGRIYYELGLIAYGYGYRDLTEVLFKKALYNNPQFASFHAELINLYFLEGRRSDVNFELEYCSKFQEAKTLCDQYRDDSLRLNIPKDVGYLKGAVDEHYGSFQVPQQ